MLLNFDWKYFEKDFIRKHFCIVHERICSSKRHR